MPEFTSRLPTPSACQPEGEKEPADAADPYVDNTDFGVKINSRPQPYSAHAKESDRKTLADVTTTKGLTRDTADPGTAIEIRLTDDANTTNAIEGYFSDKDNDPLKCRFVEHDGKEDNNVADVAWGGTVADRNELDVIPRNLGTMTVDVWCFDQVDTDGSGATDFERSEKATLTVTVTYTGSIRD